MDEGHNRDSQTARWSFGSCSTEFCFINEEEHSQRATGDPPWVDEPARRRPKVTNVITRQREGPLGPSWVNTAFLITNEDGQVIWRPAWTAKCRDPRPSTEVVRPGGDEIKVAKRRYKVVARRLTKGAVASTRTGPVVVGSPGSPRDGSAFKEVNP